MEKETEERIIALETKLAYMEDFVNQLQEVSVEQGKTVELLRTENKMMSQKIRDLSDAIEGMFQIGSHRIISHLAVAYSSIVINSAYSLRTVFSFAVRMCSLSA